MNLFAKNQQPTFLFSWKFILAFPFTNVAAICIITASTVYALLQPCNKNTKSCYCVTYNLINGLTYTCNRCKNFNYSLLHISNKGCIISPSSSISSNLAQNIWHGLILEAHQSHIPCAEDKALKGNKGQQKNLMHFTVYGTSFPQTPSFIPSVNHIREVWLFIHAHLLHLHVQC